MSTNPVPEWITRSQANSLMIVVLVLGVLVAVMAAFVSRQRGRDPLPMALLWGGPPILMGLLWHLYNFITDKLGLDSVANLLVNLALFVVLGVGVGFAARRFAREK